MMPPIIDVIGVCEDKLLYVTDKFLWGKNPTMTVIFARRKPNSSILINAKDSCRAMTML